MLDIIEKEIGKYVHQIALMHGFLTYAKIRYSEWKIKKGILKITNILMILRLTF